MTAAIDANILLYASDPESSVHQRATDTLMKRAEGPDLLYVFWPVAMAYLRIATHPSLFRHPLTHAEAAGNLDRLVSRPNVRSPGETEDFWPAYLATTAELSVRGNLVPDAHIVGLMRAYGVRTIITRDRGFRRFGGIAVEDPFA